MVISFDASDHPSCSKPISRMPERRLMGSGWGNSSGAFKVVSRLSRRTATWRPETLNSAAAPSMPGTLPTGSKPTPSRRAPPRTEAPGALAAQLSAISLAVPRKVIDASCSGTPRARINSRQWVNSTSGTRLASKATASGRSQSSPTARTAKPGMLQLSISRLRRTQSCISVHP